MREILQDATLELFLLLLKANTMDKQSRGGAEGGGATVVGCVPRICVIQTKLVLLLLPLLHLTYPEGEKEHATYLQNICHILLNGKQKILQLKHTAFLCLSLSLSLFLSSSFTHVLFKS